MLEFESQSFGHPTALDFTSAYHSHTSNNISISFNGFQFAFSTEQAVMHWSSAENRLDFSFDYSQQYHFIDGVTIGMRDELKAHKLKYIWSSGMLVSFMLFLNTANLDDTQIKNIKAAVNSSPNASDQIEMVGTTLMNAEPTESVLPLIELESKKEKKEPRNSVASSTFIEEELPTVQFVSSTSVEESEGRKTIIQNPISTSKVLETGNNTLPQTFEKPTSSEEKAVLDLTRHKVASHEVENVFDRIELHSELATIKTKAEQQQKNVILSFGAKWCAPCKMMEKGALRDEKVKSLLSDHYVMMKIDVDDFDGFNMKQHYKVNLLPTFIVLDESGEVLARYEKSFSTDEMQSMLSAHADEDVLVEEEYVASMESELDAPFTPEAEIMEIQLLKNRAGKIVNRIKANGNNWNFTKVKFKLNAGQLEQLEGKEIVIKIMDSDKQEMMSQLSLNTFTAYNTIQIAHPWKKKLASNYTIEICYRNSDGSLSQFSNGSKSITPNYDLIL